MPDDLTKKRTKDLILDHVLPALGRIEEHLAGEDTPPIEPPQPDPDPEPIEETRIEAVLPQAGFSEAFELLGAPLTVVPDQAIVLGKTGLQPIASWHSIVDIIEGLDVKLDRAVRLELTAEITLTSTGLERGPRPELLSLFGWPPAASCIGAMLIRGNTNIRCRSGGPDRGWKPEKDGGNYDDTIRLAAPMVPGQALEIQQLWTPSDAQWGVSGGNSGSAGHFDTSWPGDSVDLRKGLGIILGSIDPDPDVPSAGFVVHSLRVEVG